MTTNVIGDARTLPDLLAPIPQDEQILSVGGDGAYDTRACHTAIAERGADAVIPVRRNGQPWTKDGPGVDARNEALRATASAPPDACIRKSRCFIVNPSAI